MSEEIVQPSTEATTEEVKPIPAITFANGEKLELDANDAVLVIRLNLVNENLTIVPAQNIISVPMAKMLLTEALDRYRTIGIANQTVRTAESLKIEQAKATLEKK